MKTFLVAPLYFFRHYTSFGFTANAEKHTNVALFNNKIWVIGNNISLYLQAT